MAVNPNLPTIPVIQNQDNYIQEAFGTSHFEGAPSFLEFLTQRGLSSDFFDEATFKVLALNTELMMYNMYIKAVLSDQQSKQQTESYQKQLQTSALEDLKARAGMLASELDMINAAIEEAASELAEPREMDCGDVVQ